MKVASWDSSDQSLVRDYAPAAVVPDTGLRVAFGRMMATTGKAGQPDMPRYAPALFWTNAAVAWGGVVLSFGLSVNGHVLDWLASFTTLSNVVVAIVLTVLVWRPGLLVRPDRIGQAWRVLRLDSVLMIVIAGTVYNLVLIEGAPPGWDALSNALLHTVTPLLTLLVWIIAGPRGLITPSIVGLSLMLPLGSSAFVVARGAVSASDPNSFLDGPFVVLSVGVLGLMALLLALLLMAVDAGLRWTQGPGTMAQ